MSPVLLFDGHCNLCNATVQWVIRRDPTGKIHFASLQSSFGQELMQRHELNVADLDSVILNDQGKVYIKSSAALQVARHLGGVYAVFARFGLLLPRFIRDTVYDFVARNRYRWFGRQEECMLPRPEWKSRFLGQ